MSWLILLVLVLIFPKVFIGTFVGLVCLLWLIILGILYGVVGILGYIANLIR